MNPSHHITELHVSIQTAHHEVKALTTDLIPKLTSLLSNEGLAKIKEMITNALMKFPQMEPLVDFVNNNLEKMTNTFNSIEDVKSKFDVGGCFPLFALVLNATLNEFKERVEWQWMKFCSNLNEILQQIKQAIPGPLASTISEMKVVMQEFGEDMVHSFHKIATVPVSIEQELEKLVKMLEEEVLHAVNNFYITIL
jgi:hypothetical protein